MNTINRICILIVTIFAFGNIQAQQQKRSPEERAKRQTQMVKEQCALTDSQAVIFENIALKYSKLMEGFRDIPRDSTQLRRNKMDELNQKQTAEVKTILTPEQFVKYEKWMEENRNRMGGGGNRGGGPRNN